MHEGNEEGKRACAVGATVQKLNSKKVTAAHMWWKTVCLRWLLICGRKPPKNIQGCSYVVENRMVTAATRMWAKAAKFGIFVCLFLATHSSHHPSSLVSLIIILLLFLSVMSLSPSFSRPSSCSVAYYCSFLFLFCRRLLLVFSHVIYFSPVPFPWPSFFA